MPTLTEILAKNTIEYYDCVTINFGGVDIYHYTTCPWNLVIGGTLFESAGPLVTIGNVEENSKFDIGTLDIVLAGLVALDGDSGMTVIQGIQTLDYINKPVEITRVYLENAQVAHSEITYVGYINAITASVSNIGTTTALIQTSNHWANFNRATSRFTNEASQQAYYPNDSGFEYAKLVQKEIVWAVPA